MNLARWMNIKSILKIQLNFYPPNNSKNKSLRDRIHKNYQITKKKKEKSKKSPREKRNIIWGYKDTKFTTDFFPVSIQARRYWSKMGKKIIKVEFYMQQN